MSDAESADSFGARRQIGLSAYWFALNFQSSALLTIIIPTALDRLSRTDHTGQLARLAVLGAVIAMLIPPVTGVLSDRIRARGGQRRPMMFLGTTLNILGLAVAARASTIPGLTAGFFIAVFGQSVAGAAYQAMMPELVPRSRWGVASGYMGVATLLGNIAGLLTVGLGSEDVGYAAMAVVMVLGAMYTGLSAQEGTAAPVARTSGPRVRSRRDFLVVFLARFMVIFGQTLLMTYVLYFFQDDLHVQNAAASTALVAGMALVGAAFSSWIAGAASDVLDRPILVFLAGIPMAAAAVGFGLMPNPALILVFAVAWGFGYGAYISVDWALALDAIPDLANVARDLGVWGIASNLPAVLAPAVGGVLLVHIVPAAGAYRALFLLAGLTFILGSVIVLWVRGRYRQTGWAVGARLLVALILRAWVGLMYRVRVYGRVARRRGATLVVANHAHDLEGMVVPPRLLLTGPWGMPIHSAGSQRLFEPGFLVTRTPRWLRWLLPRLNLGTILALLGVLPIENQPRRRPLISVAFEVLGLRGDLPLRDVFEREALELLGPGADGLRLSDCWRGAWALRAQAVIPYALVREPLRSALREGTRERIERQLGRLEHALASGATVYLTPEGRYTNDGRMNRLRAALSRLLPLAEDLYIAPLSYDPFAPGPLRMELRLIRARAPESLQVEIPAARPVTASHLIGKCLGDGMPRSRAEVLQQCRQLLAELPGEAFLGRGLRRNPDRTIRRWLSAMLRRGLLRIDAAGRLAAALRCEPRFPLVTDIFDYCAAFLDETLRAIAVLEVGQGVDCEDARDPVRI